MNQKSFHKNEINYCFSKSLIQTLLHSTVEEAEKKAKAKHHPHFHPNNLQEKISTNEFIHLKLRHRDSNPNFSQKIHYIIHYSQI